MSYTVEDLIKDLSNFPKDAQVRVRDFEEHSNMYYELAEPSLEEEWESGVKHVVIY